MGGFEGFKRREQNILFLTSHFPSREKKQKQKQKQKKKVALLDFVPVLAMVLVQVGYSGMSILWKLAMDDGTHPLVLVTYRQVVATITTAPFAFFLEWKTRPNITLSILFQIFLCSITGAFMNQALFFKGLNISSPVISGAMSNTLPALTFVFALIFRQESHCIKTNMGRAKVIGTLICVGGAMLLSFYHGHTIAGSSTDTHWRYAMNTTGKRSTHQRHPFLGFCLLFCSVSGLALWFIIQAKLTPKFPAPYTTTTLMCFMATIECAIVGAATEHNMAAWSLRSRIRLIAIVYAGVVCSVLAFCIMTWCVNKKGALYTSVFSPLVLLMSTLLSWALLHEKLYMGILDGAVVIIAGLYSVLWAKGKEANESSITQDIEQAS